MPPRVLLVKPPEKSAFNFGTFSLAVLAAAIRDVADVSLFDATDLSIAAASEAIVSRQPDIVGITAMAMPSVAPVAELARHVRNAIPSVRLVAGGHGGSMAPRHLLNAGVDVVVIGEGETTFRRLLLEGFDMPIPGVARWSEGRLSIACPAALVDDLDALPPPARDLMPSSPDGVHLIETSRGCPHACSFCETTRFYGRRWRFRSPETVAEEVRRLVEDFDAWIIEITDDNFAASPRRVLRICDELRKGPLPLFFMLSVRADDLYARPELIEALVSVRMVRVGIGVETLDPGVAATTGKAIPLDAYRAVFENLRQSGALSLASFIVGLPGETPDARRRAVELAVEAAPDAAQFVPFHPYPGLPLYGRSDGSPAVEDTRDAEAFTNAFYSNERTRERLMQAAGGDGVRAILAQKILAKSAHLPQTAS